MLAYAEMEEKAKGKKENRLTRISTESDAMVPIVQTLYQTAHVNVMLKNDKSAFTMADAIVQVIGRGLRGGRE